MSNRSPATITTKEKSSVMPMRSSLIQRQCACGNSAGMAGECSDCQNKSLVQRKSIDQDNTSEEPPIAHEFPIQTKLTVGKPGDIYEQEADRVAAQVMSMGNSSPSIQPATAMGKKEVQTKRSNDGESAVGSNIESRLSSSKGGGSPLSSGVRSFMERRFGTDFSQVRVHTGSEAIQMNRELNAQAFTQGQDVYFGVGKIPANDSLTAHELTHVVQQTGSLQPKSVGININSSTESIQRKMNDGYDLQSTRFKGIPDLEDCYHDEARLTMNGMGQPGTRKVQSGTGVQKVKEALVELGYLNEIVDENYTQATWDAVKALKTDKRLGWETMGDVGPVTMAWLDRNVRSTSGEKPTVPPESKPLKVCGPDVTQQVKDAIKLTKAKFNSGWTNDRKETACQHLTSIVYGWVAWDIIPLNESDWILRDYGSVCASKETAPSCIKSIQVDGQCFYAGSVNYVVFGTMFDLCNTYYATAYPLNNQFTQNEMLKWIDWYKGKGWTGLQTPRPNFQSSNDWALAGFNIWPHGALTPSGDRPDCSPTCSLPYQGGAFTVNWDGEKF
jgi:hypothetical protein